MDEESYYWDGKLDYLRKSTILYYNDDYIKFLVDNVWRIDTPVHVIDFGCGYGHLGLRLMPLLPQGSRYTGVDAGSKLIAYAKQLFAELPFESEFVLGDFHEIAFERKYDLAVCHGVLLHMTDPLAVLEKMMDCVKDRGKIIAFEPSWIGSVAGFHFERLRQSGVIPLGQLQELFERDAERTGKDGNIGLKLPLYFNRLGLQDVQCRVSDKVNVHDPEFDPETASKLFEAMRFYDPGDREVFVCGLIERGMKPEEADRQYEAEKLLAEAFTSSTAAAYAPVMKITFGTVVRN